MQLIRNLPTLALQPVLFTLASSVPSDILIPSRPVLNSSEQGNQKLLIRVIADWSCDATHLSGRKKLTTQPGLRGKKL